VRTRGAKNSETHENRNEKSLNKSRSQVFFSSVCFIKRCCDCKIKDYVMGGVCNMHGTLDQCILSVSQKLTCRDGLEDLGMRTRTDATQWI
jgi:hypothetical protein